MHRTSIKAVVLWLALVLFMSVSHPAKLPTVGLILPFIILYAAVLHTVEWLIEYMGKTRLPTVSAARRRIPPIVTTAVVLVVALQSIGQLTVRDALAVFLVVALGYFYLYRNGVQQK